MKINKIKIRNFLLHYSGYSYLKWKSFPKGLYCFNYHRIGESKQTRFDKNIYSCSAKTFEQHLLFFKKDFEVITIEHLKRLIDIGKPLDKHYALITFDDGYLDNYQLAFPLLKKYNMSAAFFIASDYIESNKITWWDEIAWMINQCDLKTIKLPNWDKEVTIDKKNIDTTMRQIINKIKQYREIPIDVVLDSFREITMLEFTEYDNSFFMNWDMLEEMVNSGMDICSHSCSHKILSHLPADEQFQEIVNSKKIIESKLGVKVDVFAYPEGGVRTYSKITLDLLQKANYQLAFNFIPGFNPNPCKNVYELKRMPVSDNPTVNDLKILSIFYAI